MTASRQVAVTKAVMGEPLTDREAAPPRTVVRIIARLNIGGPARHVALLAEHLDPDRFPTLLVTGQPSRDEGSLAHLLPERTRHMTIAQIRREIRPWDDLIALWKLCRIVSRERPDILHTHTAKAGTLGRLAGLWYRLVQQFKGSQRRLVIVHTFHGHVLSGYFHPVTTWCFTMIERWLAKHSDALIAVSPSVRENLLRLSIGRPDQVRVVPLGLDLAALLQVNGYRQGLRRELGIATGTILIGIVGRLVPIKAHERFLEAAKELLRRRAAMRFVIVGDGECRTRLERLARSIGVAEQVSFIGWQVDLPGVYADLDVVCLTSLNEGTPVSVIEAMAAGRPVVATAVGGVPDLFGGIVERTARYDVADRGIAVPSEKASEGLVEAIERLLGDEALRRRITMAGREFVSRHLGAGRLAADVTALYEELCGDRLEMEQGMRVRQRDRVVGRAWRQGQEGRE